MNLFEVGAVEVGVNLGSGYIGMAQKLLYVAEIGAAFEEMRGEGVTQGMWADFFPDTAFVTGGLDNFPDAHPGEWAALDIEEDMVARWGAYEMGSSLLQVVREGAYCLGPNGDQALAKAATQDAYQAVFEQER